MEQIADGKTPSFLLSQWVVTASTSPKTGVGKGHRLSTVRFYFVHYSEESNETSIVSFGLSREYRHRISCEKVEYLMKKGQSIGHGLKADRVLKSALFARYVSQTPCAQKADCQCTVYAVYHILS